MHFSEDRWKIAGLIKYQSNPSAAYALPGSLQIKGLALKSGLYPARKTE
jgi:hypothetical protein